MTASFVLEDQTDSDLAAVEALLDASFGIGRRTKTSYRLREGASPVAGLSMLVRDAELGLSGTISFWPLRIGKAGTPALLLGPLAVHPQRQNLGIGLALMREGLARAKALGHSLVVLVGDEPYYARVGFRRLPRGLLMLPGPFDPERFLYCELVPGALQGTSGMVLPAHRHAQASTTLAVPHGSEAQQQSAQGKQGSKKRDVSHGRHAIGPVVAKADPACA
jgi:predicted N-acetyltransferase YhbS